MRRARIADLDQRFTLERPIDAPDDVGGVTRTWAAVDTVWGALRLAAGAEQFAADREESALVHRILMRWRPDVTAAMRLRLGARTFAIRTACDHDTRRRFMMLTCEEIA